MRSLFMFGSLLFLLAHISIKEPDTHTRFTDEEEMNELTSAASHLSATNLPDIIPTISRGAQGHITTFRLGVIDAATNWTSWSPEDRLVALRKLTNSAAAVGAVLDRELAGIASDLSDPGTSF